MDYEKKYKEANDKVAARFGTNVAKEIFTDLYESEDERIGKVLVGFFKSYKEQGTCGAEKFNGIPTDDILAWLEKQGEKLQKTSMWKHWKNGIAGNGEGKPIYLIKYGYSYSLSSCLCFKCDYIELSELDKLLSEKQGEQKPTDKIEPKFKVGDWIVWQNKCYKVNYNGCGYELVDQNYLSTSLEYRTVDESAYLWTIQDAKDGDVLLFEGYYNSIVLFQGIGINGKGRINYHCKCDLGNYSFGVQGDVACLGTIEKDAEHYHPATKEQRDLLFQKMHEAGYMWDSEKKELKKISQRMISAEAKEVMYSNPAWSEKDEGICNGIINDIDDDKSICKYEISKRICDEKIKWLKSLKQRIQHS